MGTNYYYEDISGKKYHIGKSSYGWQFSFQAQPKLDVYSNRQWKSFLSEKQQEYNFHNVNEKSIVVNEYDERVDIDEFFDDIVSHSVRLKRWQNDDNSRKKLKNQTDYVEGSYYEGQYYNDIDGYSFTIGDFS